MAMARVVSEQKQRKVLNSVMTEGKSMKRAMMDAGYSETYAHASTNMTETKSWRKILAEVNDENVMSRIYEILEDTDKRASLQAADMILKLKDKYPSNKSKTINYQVDMDGLMKEE